MNLIRMNDIGLIIYRFIISIVYCVGDSWINQWYKTNNKSDALTVTKMTETAIRKAFVHALVHNKLYLVVYIFYLFIYI